jgi:hypothetical protein
MWMTRPSFQLAAPTSFEVYHGVQDVEIRDVYGIHVRCILLFQPPEMKHCLVHLFFKTRSQDSSVGIATGYGLDGRGSNPGRGKIFLFSTASRPALRPTQPLIQWVLEALSPGVKRPGRQADH